MPFYDRFRALSSNQQLLVVALVVAVVGSLIGGSWYFLFRTVYQPLFTELKPVDAATIVADLEKKKIPYELAEGGATILVPSEQADATRLEVMTEDLPLKGTVGFELFNKSDMGLTDFAQKINYQRALQGELERTIMSLDGVESARVELAMGEDRIFRDDRIPPKASVSIRMKAGAALPDSAARGIEKMIAASVPNLDADNVVILNEEGQVVGAPAPVTVAKLPSPADQEKSAIGQYYAARIRESLDGAYADAQIDVAVLDPVQVQGGATPASSVADWTPGARRFGLAVTISSPVALDPDGQDTLRRFVASVIGTSAANADQVSFAVVPSAGQAALPAAKGVKDGARAAVPVQEARNQPGALAIIALALATVLALAGVYLFVFQLRKPRRMSDDERNDFAARLRAAINDGGARRAA